MSIFDFWSSVPGNAHCHPDDQAVLGRAAHSFQLGGLPNPYFGPLKSARVVLLFLSPGYRDADAKLASQRSVHEYFQQQRTGLAHLPSETDYEPTWNWWRERIEQFGISPEDARGNVAFLNICAYRSGDFSDHPMLAALPSSRAALDWAQSSLFPAAIAGDRVVVCLRSPLYWGLSNKGTLHGVSLYAPRYTPGGHMHGDAMRDAVAAAVQDAVVRSI